MAVSCYNSMRVVYVIGFGKSCCINCSAYLILDPFPRQALRGMQGLEVHPVARIMEAVDQADRQAIRREETAGGARQ